MNETNASPRRQLFAAALTPLLLLAVTGVGAPHLFGCHRGHHAAGEQQTAALYTCPMHPQYTSDKPGTCPICGMALVPKKEAAPGMPEMQEPKPAPGANAGGTPEQRSAVRIDAEKQQRIGVTTAVVGAGPAMAAIRAAGTVAFDPELAVSQREFLEARRLGDASLARAARERLAVQGMSAPQIQELERRGKPEEGLVLPARSAWVYATVYERELPLLREGQQARIELPDGSAVGSGTIRAVASVIDPQTRSARARIEVNNEAGKLRPNQFVTAILNIDLGEKLLVPASAVIDSGTRKLVFLVRDGLDFLPREVALGPETAGGYVVESGLSAGDVVAKSALFLIDSESRLTAGSGMAGEHRHGAEPKHD